MVAIEERTNDSGVIRVHFAQGWTSMVSGAGDPILQLVGEEDDDAIE